MISSGSSWISRQGEKLKQGLKPFFSHRVPKIGLYMLQNEKLLSMVAVVIGIVEESERCGK